MGTYPPCSEQWIFANYHFNEKKFITSFALFLWCCTLGFFDTEKNVFKYIKIAEGYDGRELISILEGILPPSTTVLELGMGPGKDLDILSENYKVTGSDLSKVFIDLYRKKNPGADLLLLDAVTLKTQRKFDCIYSNKVLQHISKDDLKVSFQRQWEILNDNGILFHTFWKGDREEMMNDLLFVYHTVDGLKELIGDRFQVIRSEIYTEMEEDDSILIVLRKQ